MNKLGKGEAGHFPFDFVRCSDIYQIEPNFNLIIWWQSKSTLTIFYKILVFG